MVNDTFLVDTVKVAKQAKQAGEFMIAACDSGNLLITGQFVLSLSEDQFWSVQCKLEIPQLGKWYLQTKKDGLWVSEREPELEGWEERYNNWLNDADPGKKLTNTMLGLSECYLYTDGLIYTAIKQERIGMLASSEDLYLSGRMIVVDGVHVIAPMSDKVWQTNAWIRQLPGVNTESEKWEEK